MAMRAMLVMGHANALAVTPGSSAIPLASKELGGLTVRRSALTVRIMANAIQSTANVGVQLVLWESTVRKVVVKINGVSTA